MTTKRHQNSVFNEWENLLREFGSISPSIKSDSQSVSEFNRLLRDYDEQQASWHEEQKHRADAFNILRTMRLTRRELCHSDILAWLLDPQGTHGQGNLGFIAFLRELNLPIEFARKKYRVIRELAGEESQLDIAIEAEREFIIGIENKIDADEGDNQTEREWRDLQRRKKHLAVSAEITALFLTPDRKRPSCDSFRPISWQVIANVFEAFASEAKAEMVKLFAKHYAETIRHELEPEIEEDEEWH